MEPEPPLRSGYGFSKKGWYFNSNILCCCPSAKLPKWFGERPGKKPGDPESPDDEDEGPAEVPPGAEEEEEEEEEDEEEEEEE